MTLLIHEDNNVEGLLFKYGTVPELSSMDNSEFNTFVAIIKHQLKGGDKNKWNKIPNNCMIFS